MLQRRSRARIGFTLLTALVGLGSLGQSCPSFPFPPPIGGDPVLDEVDVELINLTAFEVDPRLFVDPDDTIVDIDDLIREENFVDIGPPLEPDEVVTVTFDCLDIGSVVSDYALLLISDSEAVESDNGPWLVGGENFLCGDVISFIYIDTPEDGFFTRVEVNGEFLTD